MTIIQLIQFLVGPAGHYFRGLWEPDEVLSNLLWSADVTVSRVVAVQIINGQRALAHKHTEYYRKSDGYALLEDDLLAFVLGYPSTAMLRDIQLRIHMAVAASDWSPAQINALDHYYIADNPSRDQIAIYIAHVMYAIICS